MAFDSNCYVFFLHGWSEKEDIELTAKHEGKLNDDADNADADSGNISSLYSHIRIFEKFKEVNCKVQGTVFFFS